MKDIFDYLHEQDEDLDHLPRVELLESEKKDALRYIRMREKESADEDCFCEQKDSAEERNPKTMKKSTRRSTIAAVLAAALAVGGTAYAAVRWNRGLEEGMQISQEQQDQLATENYAQTVGQSVTDAGVTVSVDQCIVDNYFAYLSFNVTGYQLPNGAEPFIDETNISVDGKDGYAGGGGFYDGIVSASDGSLVYADGSELETDENGTAVTHYVQADGSLQYVRTVSAGMDKGALIGKPIHVELKNLGTVDRTGNFTPDVEGTWTFDFTLPGSSSAKEVKLDASLGDTGATVSKAEISPVSLYVEMNFPRQVEMTEYLDDGNGQTEVYTQWQDAPALTGVRLKDGTLIPYIVDGGGAGYMEETGDTYIQRRGLNRVIDVQQVDALLFYKTPVEDGKQPTEDNFYVVPIQ
jgi:hypothetical protein